MRLKTYLEKPITRKWFDEILVDLKYHTEVTSYYEFNTLLNSITYEFTAENDNIIVIDLDSVHYIELINQINELYTNTKIIGIGYPRNMEKTLDVLRNGVQAYLEIGNSPIDFYNALKSIKNGIMYLPMYKVDEFIKTLVKKNFKLNIKTINEAPHKINNQLNALTAKQREVCDYLLKGYSYKEISQFLGVTTFTINQRAKSIYRKMEVNSRGELSYLFIK